MIERNTPLVSLLKGGAIIYSHVYIVLRSVSVSLNKPLSENSNYGKD